MAGNDWLNSYLEAILDVGPGLEDSKSSLLLRERGRFSPTRYFVEEVIGFDETDLYRSWVRVCSLLFSLSFWFSSFTSFRSSFRFCLGFVHQESSGEEHQVGEHVLADLEPCSPEEAGSIIDSRLPILDSQSRRFWIIINCVLWFLCLMMCFDRAVCVVMELSSWRVRRRREWTSAGWSASEGGGRPPRICRRTCRKERREIRSVKRQLTATRLLMATPAGPGCPESVLPGINGW